MLLYLPRVDVSTSRATSYAFSFGGSISTVISSDHFGHKQIPNDLLAQFSCGLFIEGILAEIFLRQFPEGEKRDIGLGDQFVQTQLADS